MNILVLLTLVVMLFLTFSITEAAIRWSQTRDEWWATPFAIAVGLGFSILIITSWILAVLYGDPK